MAVLLDSNVLIALQTAGHVHHARARLWLASLSEPFATCPITEGSLVRLMVRNGEGGDAAHAQLQSLRENPRHEFWPDDVFYRDVPLRGVIGHRQVTDAYLVELARKHNGKLATFDKGLAALHGDAVQVVPTSPE
jgi:toxin-antitoxin system PIN domain toxin